MTALRRTFGLAVALFALSPFTLADLQSDFGEAIQALRRNERDRALEILKGIVASNPDNDEAYDLWRNTEEQAWLDILVAGDQFELYGKRLMALAEAGRKEKRNDADAIKELVRQVQSEDVIERRRAVLQLSSDHGEYATPYLLRGLADQDDDERRVMCIRTLTEMSTDVVPGLVAALDAEDAFTRRNVAYALGHIRDPRAAGALQLMANTDEDGQAREAAADAARRCGSNGNALQLLLDEGDAYHHRRGTVLRADHYSDVTWSMEDGELVPTEVPRFLYNDEMAIRAYRRALEADPNSLDAMAGLARAYVSEQEKLSTFEAAGALDAFDNADELRAHVGNLAVAASAAPNAALDRALSWAVAQGDTTAGVALSRKLGEVAGNVPAGLRAAVQSADGAIAAEAAVAIGNISYRTGQSADGVVAMLGEAAGRDIQRIAAVIDADQGRANAVASALRNAGMLVNTWNTGAKALATLNRVPGLDVVILADQLPDLTTNQVLVEVRDDARTAETPVFILAADADAASELYGDQITGAMSAPDASMILEALGDDMSADRREADALSQRAASTLANLALAGRTNIGGAVQKLESTLANRPDAVTIPAMQALAAAGGESSIGALAALLASDDRSDEARAAAGHAIAGILGRTGGNGGGAALNALMDVMNSDASLSVRSAASAALGRMSLDAEARARLFAGGASN